MPKNSHSAHVEHDHDYDPFSEPPDCVDEKGHAWVMGRPIFSSEDAERIPENIEWVTGQCRRCGWHDMRPPEDYDAEE